MTLAPVAVQKERRSKQRNMQIDYKKLNLDNHSAREIERLLAVPQGSRSDLEHIWFLMDTIWDEYGCDNQCPDWDVIGKFYCHPVWLLNGLFIEQDELSMQHRKEISDWVADAEFETVVDYGGGFGTLAKLIAQKNPGCNVDIYEPHEISSAMQKLASYERIRFVRVLDRYDCLVSTDVLEHVPDPLGVLSDMKNAVKDNGFLVIANNFNPVVKCHLPRTFHLKYSFDFFARKMGLIKAGPLHGSHATIYRKEKMVANNLPGIRKYEKCSIACFPVIEGVRSGIRSIGRVVKTKDERIGINRGDNEK